MRVRIGSTATTNLGLATGIAGPIYSAFGGQSAAPSTVAGTAGRIMR